MREIKFRGKRKLNGDWIYGSLIQIGNDWCQIVPVGTEYDEIGHEMIRVISETVGQYTGIQDIYEGDIVKVGDKVMQVIYKDGCFYTPYNESNYRLGGWKLHTVKVIGNIHEIKYLNLLK